MIVKQCTKISKNKNIWFSNGFVIGLEVFYYQIHPIRKREIMGNTRLVLKAVYISPRAIFGSIFWQKVALSGNLTSIGHSSPRFNRCNSSLLLKLNNLKPKFYIWTSPRISSAKFRSESSIHLELFHKIHGCLCCVNPVAWVIKKSQTLKSERCRNWQKWEV